jgi:hypothetical protein
VRKQQTLKFSLIISVFSIFIFSFSYYGGTAFGSRSASNLVFSENTYIGTVDVSNKTHDEAKAAIEAKTNEWAAVADIQVEYKGQIYKIPASDFVFLIEESVASAVHGKQNELQLELKETALETISLPKSLAGSLDQEKLVKELLEAGSGFVQAAEISLEAYLPQEEPEVIAEASIKLPLENIEVGDFVETMPSIEIAAESQFSLASIAEESGLSNISNHTYSQIASAIYEAVLPTNFTIAERHISSRLAENINPGFEAKVDFEKNLDLKLFNPNEHAYKITLALSGQELKVTISGVPLLYDYKIATVGKQEFKPRTIKQFSPLLKQGQKTVEKEGQPGLLIKVNREIYGQDGELLKTELLSEDFYPPVHRIEIHPILPAAQSTAPATSGTDVTAPTTGQTGNDQGLQVPNPGTPADSGTNEDSENSDDTEDDESTDDGSLYGKPNEQPK